MVLMRSLVGSIVTDLGVTDLRSVRMALFFVAVGGEDALVFFDVGLLLCFALVAGARSLPGSPRPASTAKQATAAKKHGSLA